MPIEFLKFGFTAGELSPDLYGRGDLEGFQSGFRDSLNVLVDWRGGIRSRPGTVFCEPIFEDTDNPGTRLSAFSFNADPEDNYLLLWLHQKLYFVQEGNYLLTGTFQNGNSMSFPAGTIVAVHDNNENFLYTASVKDNNEVYVPYKEQSRTLFSSHRVKRVYTIMTPFNYEDLLDLKFLQFRDDVIVTHASYAPRRLKRTLSDSGDPLFSITTLPFIESSVVEDKEATEEDRTTSYASNRGGFQWTVGIVDKDDVEHPIPWSDGNSVGPTVDIGDKYLDLTWSPHFEASAYKVYGSAFKGDFDEALSLPLGSFQIVGIGDPPNMRFDTLAGQNVRDATFGGGEVYLLMSDNTIRVYEPDATFIRSFAATALSGSFSSQQGLYYHPDFSNSVGDALGVMRQDGRIRRMRPQPPNGYFGNEGAAISTTWRGIVYAKNYLWAVGLTGSTFATTSIIKIDPITFVKERTFSLPSASYRNIVAAGSTVWAFAHIDMEMIAFNIDLEVLTPELNYAANLWSPAGLGSPSGAYLHENSIWMVANDGVAVHIQLVEGF